MLRPGDMFTLRLGGMPPDFANEFALDYTVGSDGTVNIPMVGDMRAAGMTSTQFQQAVQNRLISDKIFTRPTVVIGIQQNIRFVSVGGGVRTPGRQPWSPDLTLNSAVQGAGGLTDFGSPKGCRLIRDGQVSVFDLRALDKNPAADPKLLPGDQVVVRQ
ncbi:MAG: Polysaccharide biosynthesis/export protein [Chthoniobacter sp.]|nr:Polysaccharide biosynthesis/export protein [Chthoniobacter sp.]